MSETRLEDLRIRTGTPEPLPARERLPRATQVSDRIQALLDAMPRPDTDAVASFRRAQLEGYQLALAYTFAWGQDIDEQEHAEWLCRLDEWSWLFHNGVHQVEP
jgi:hypothetical protein